MDDAAITQAVPALRATPYQKQGSTAAQSAQQTARAQQPDTVEISPEAQRMSHDTRSTEPGVRTELVDRIRSQLAEGTYDTEEKLDQALEAMIDRLAQEEERAEQE